MVERVRRTLFLIVVAAGALLAACGGGTSPSVFFSPGAPLADLAPESVAIRVKPHALSFDSYGATFTKKVVVSEKGYAGKFVEHSTCKGVVKASPLSGKGPKLKVKVTPLADGTCVITFVDAKKHKAKLSIIVDATKPTPSPSTAPSSSPTTGPTPGAGPAIYVTYTASTAHPNVVAYDEQGNTKSTGSWPNAGKNPQSIVWAPQDLHWFYLTANNGTASYTVMIYESSGSPFGTFSGTDAGAIAYESQSPYYLYVASTASHTIHAYDKYGSEQTTSFPTTIDTTLGGIAYDSNMSRIYVANTMSGKVEYYSTGGTLGSSISAPCICAPGAIAFDPGNNDIYVWWNGSGGGMSAYNESGTAVTLSGGSGTPFAGLTAPQAIAVDMHNGYLYITNGTSVKVYDSEGNSIATSGSFSPGFTAASANGVTVNPP